MIKASAAFVGALIAPTKEAVREIDRDLAGAGFIRFNSHNREAGWHHPDGSHLAACEVTKGERFVGYVLVAKT
jgi:hypothetical protein